MKLTVECKSDDSPVDVLIEGIDPDHLKTIEKCLKNCSEGCSDCSGCCCEECYKDEDEFKDKENYIIINSFNILDLWNILDDNRFHNLLVECEMTYWGKWPVSKVFDEFNSFDEDDIPETLWQNRDILEGEGFIEQIFDDMDVLLEPGMQLHDSFNELYIVFYDDTGDNDTLGIVSAYNHNVLAFFERGTTLDELNDSIGITFFI